MLTSGSPKQIAWAEKIVKDRLAKWKRSDPVRFGELEATINSQTAASWWITHREMDLDQVIGSIGGTAGKLKPKSSSKASVTTSPSSAGSMPRGYVHAMRQQSDGGYRYVGLTFDTITGEVVVDGSDCPF